MEEVVQEALVTCYENIRKYELRGTFLSWVKGIARNVLRSETRERAKYVSAEEDALEGLLARSGQDFTHEENEYEETWIERLRECLKKTPQDIRGLLDRRYAEGLPIAGIAENVGKSESWVAVTLFRTRERLRKCMAAESAGRMG
jgi:RNA polymerase sigma factor (sigma-70 family)